MTLYKRRGFQGGCSELNFIEISFYFEKSGSSGKCLILAAAKSKGSVIVKVNIEETQGWQTCF
jgi:hypothetical protein